MESHVEYPVCPIHAQQANTYCTNHKAVLCSTCFLHIDHQDCNGVDLGTYVSSLIHANNERFSIRHEEIQFHRLHMENYIWSTVKDLEEKADQHKDNVIKQMTTVNEKSIAQLRNAIAPLEQLVQKLNALLERASKCTSPTEKMAIYFQLQSLNEQCAQQRAKSVVEVPDVEVVLPPLGINHLAQQ